jgi:FKBP-type peptidyl-prolyl cis-trans isomerase 2
MPAKKTAEKPADRPADKAINNPTEKPANKAVEKPTEKNNASISKAGSNATNNAVSNAGVKVGDKVKIDYTGRFDDGTVFDASEKHGQCLEFEIGAKQIIPGFENAIIGMKKGEEKDIKLQPSEAYGDVNPQLFKKIEREHLPKDQEPQVDMILVINLPNGMQVPAIITEITLEDVTINLNHPLAGKVLNFKIKVVEINP